MTTPVAYCGACGAPNHGTRFCEACGAPGRETPLAAAPVPPTPVAPVPVPPVPPPPLYAQPARVPGAGLPEGTLLGLRWSAFGLYGLNALLLALAYLTGTYFFYGTAGMIVSMLLVLVSGILAVIAAFGGWATEGRRVAAGLSAVGYLALHVFLVSSNLLGIGGDIEWATLANMIGSVLIPALGFASWGLSRPFAGAGWFGGLVPLVAGGVLVVILNGIGYQLAGSGNDAYEVLFKLATVLGLLVTVVAVVLAWSMEGDAFARVRRQRAAQPTTGDLAPAAPGAVDPYRGSARGADPALAGRTNTLAILALVFGLLGSSVVPIVLGFVALGQIRRTGEQGRGMAIAGVVLGFIGVGALVVLLIVYIVMVAGIGAYSYYY